MTSSEDNANERQPRGRPRVPVDYPAVDPPSARPPITVALAVVRWQHSDRFGLEFVRFADNAKGQLEDMLNQQESTAAD